MTADADEIVTFRLPAKDREAIQRLVDEGHYRNRSDFLRYAIKKTLHEDVPRASAGLDLEIEGVELTSGRNNQTRPANRRKGVRI